MPISEVISLHNGPSLQDIPEQLRHLADMIEEGKRGDVDGMFVLIPQEQGYPVIIAWGIDDGAYDPIIQFELARQWLVRCAAGLPLE